MGKMRWADLLPELVVSIAERLPVSDYCRFRAVCRSWVSALKDFRPKPTSHCFPWLALVVKYNNNDHSRIIFLNPSEERRKYCISLPDNCFPRNFRGHSNGWMVFVLDSLHVVVLNPLTGAKLYLPSLSTLNQDIYLEDVEKVVLSATPSHACPPSVAVVIYGEYSLAFTRLGDDRWIHLYEENPSDDDDDDLFGDKFDKIEDVVYHDGRFFAILLGGRLIAFDHLSDPSSAPPRISILASKYPTLDWFERSCPVFYLVSAPCGDLLLVGRWDWIDPCAVMKFDIENDGWVEMKDLANGCLFYNRTQAMLLSDNDDQELKGNCIYYAKPYFGTPSFPDLQASLGYSARVYEMGSSISKPCFPPNMHVPFDPPVEAITGFYLTWFMPSL